MLEKLGEPSGDRTQDPLIKSSLRCSVSQQFATHNVAERCRSLHRRHPSGTLIFETGKEPGCRGPLEPLLRGPAGPPDACGFPSTAQVSSGYGYHPSVTPRLPATLILDGEVAAPEADE